MHTYGQGLWNAQMRCGHPSCGDSRSSQDKDRSPMVQMSMSDSFARNQNISRDNGSVSKGCVAEADL